MLYALPDLEGGEIIIFWLYLSYSESILINEQNKQNGGMIQDRKVQSVFQPGRTA